MYPELGFYYKAVKDISIHCWWRYAAKNPRMTTQVSSVFSVLSGRQPKSVQCTFYKQTCSLCYGQLGDNAIHVIYECPELEYVRTRFLPKTSFCVSYLDSKAHTSESWMIFIEILLALSIRCIQRDISCIILQLVSISEFF